MKKLLFCSHDLSITGAPLILTEIALAFRERGYEVALFSPIAGPLDTQDLTVTHTWNPAGYDYLFVNTVLNYWAVRENAIWLIHEHDPRPFHLPKDIPRYFQKAHAICFACQATADVYPCKANVHIIPTIPQPLSRIPRTNPNFTVLNVGTLSHRKGQIDLLRASRLLPAQITVKLVGECKDDFERLLPFFPVRWEPPTSCPAEHYSNADLFVCCSRSESFPRVLVEAREYNLPIISTKVGGIAEILGNGNYYKIGDYHDLAKRIMDSPANCPNLPNLPSFEEMVDRYEELLG